MILAGVAAALAAGGWWLPDLGLRWGVLRGLDEVGWTQASLARARLSLLRGDVIVRDMRAATDAMAEALGIDGIDLTFRWRPLWSRRLWLERLTLERATMDLQRQGGVWRLNGLPLDFGGDAAAAGRWEYGVGALTLLDSRVVVHDGPNRTVLEVDRLELSDLRSWTPDQPVAIALRGRLDGAAIRAAGSLRPFAEGQPFDLRLGAEGVDLARLAGWGGLGDWSGVARLDLRLEGGDGAGRPISADGTIAIAEPSIPLTAGSLKAGAVEWRGRLRWSGGLSAQGALQARSLAVVHDDLTVAAGAIHLDIEDGTVDRRGEKLRWAGGLSAQGWDLRLGRWSVHHDRLRWTGASGLDLSAKAVSLFQGEGRAESGATTIDGAGWHLSARTYGMEGHLAHGPADGLLPPLGGTLAITAEGVTLRQEGRDWLTADRLQAQGMTLRPTGVGVDRLEAGNLALLSRPGQYGARLRVPLAIAETLSLDGQGNLAAASLALRQPLLRVRRDGQGIRGIADLPVSAGGEGEGNSGPRLALDRLQVSEGGKVEFVDTTPGGDMVRLTLSALDLSLSGLDSARPGQDSPFSLTAAIGGATLSAQGWVRPFRPDDGARMQGRVRALDLPPLSPYAAAALGVNLHTGHLDADVALDLRAGTLDGRLDLVLSRLRVAAPDPLAPLARQANLPVETVLDLLRDQSDRIALTIPVHGELSNPAFDISDAVNQAIGGALKATLFTTLKVAFPVAALIGMVIDQDENPSLSLQALRFAEGSATLDAGEVPALAKVADLLRRHDGVGLNLCGVAAETADGAALRRQTGLLDRLQSLMRADADQIQAERERERLRRLADARAQAAKSWLVEQGGIDPGRLYTCRARIEAGPQDKGPRVDLVL